MWYNWHAKLIKRGKCSDAAPTAPCLKLVPDLTLCIQIGPFMSPEGHEHAYGNIHDTLYSSFQSI